MPALAWGSLQSPEPRPTSGRPAAHSLKAAALVLVHRYFPHHLSSHTSLLNPSLPNLSLLCLERGCPRLCTPVGTSVWPLHHNGLVPLPPSPLKKKPESLINKLHYYFQYANMIYYLKFIPEYPCNLVYSQPSISSIIIVNNIQMRLNTYRGGGLMPMGVSVGGNTFLGP